MEDSNQSPIPSTSSNASGNSPATLVPDGVEENVASRFVDYTFATPWEVLIGDIEQAIKVFLGKSMFPPNAVNSNSPKRKSTSNTQTTQPIILEYEDFKFSIALEQAEESVLLSNWFGLTGPYFAVFHRGEWRNDIDPSSRRTFFSAVVAALSSIDTPYPILFIPATRLNIEKPSEILGYRIRHLPPTTLLPWNIITHYDSMKEDYYDRVSSYKHNLFYLDGAYEHFLDRLSNYPAATSLFPLSNKETVDAVTSVEVMEQYNCANDALKFMAMYHYNESCYLTKDQSWLMTTLQQQWQYLRRGFKYHSNIPISDSNGSGRNRSVSSSAIGLDEFEDDSFRTKSPLETRSALALESIKNLEVFLTYRGNRSNFRVDNSNYTTMNPSNQPASAWACKVTFMFQSSSRPQSKAITSQQLMQQRFGHDCSASLRHLLVNYIISQCTSSGVALGNLFHLRSKPNQVVNIEKAKLIATNLSLGTKELVSDMGQRIIEAYRNHVVNVSTGGTVGAASHQQEQSALHARFIKRLFSSHASRSQSNSPIPRPTSRTIQKSSNSSNSKSSTESPMKSPSQQLLHELTLKIFPYLNELSHQNINTSGTNSNTSDIEVFPNNNNNNININNNETKMENGNKYMDVESPSLGWMALMAIYTSTLSDGLWSVSGLWPLCVQAMRDCWDNGNPLLHIRHYVPLNNKVNGSRPVSESSGNTLDILSHAEESQSTINNNNNSICSNQTQRLNAMTFDSLHDVIGQYTCHCKNVKLRHVVIDGNNHCKPLNPNVFLCQLPLWYDVIEELRLSNDWRYLSLPERTLSLVNQKLQMLQFCIAIKDKSHLVTTSTVAISNEQNGSSSTNTNTSEFKVQLLRRMPLTDDSICQYYRLTDKIRNRNGKITNNTTTNIESNGDANASVSMNSIDMKVSNDLSNDSQQKLFHCQVLAPSLVSDIKAFRATYPMKTFSDFCEWYGVDIDALTEYVNSNNNNDMSEPNVLSEPLSLCLHRVWEYCDNPLPGSPSNMTNISTSANLASEQKPLFRVETEAEKCLTYFENMTATRFYVEALAASMPAMFILLAHDVCHAIIDIYTCPGNAGSSTTAETNVYEMELKSICDEIIDKLTELYDDIADCTKELRRNTTTSSCDNSESKTCVSPSDDNTNASEGNMNSTLLHVEAVIDKIVDLEDFLLRFRSLCILLTPPAVDASGVKTKIVVDFKDIKKLALRLWKCGSDSSGNNNTNIHVTAQTEVEASILRALAKNSMVPGTHVNEMARGQGRELCPLKKSITIKRNVISPQNLTMLKSSRVSGKQEQRENMMSALGELESDFCHRLSVNISDDHIRASFAIVDFDL